MSCCTNTYNLGCFNNCSIIAVGLCLTSGTYNGVFTYGNISTTITVTAIENEPFLFDLSLLNENATFTLAIYDENENQITLTIDSVDYDCFKVKTQVDSVKVTQGTIIGCTPMCKEIYDPNDENTAVLFTVAVDGTTITGDGTVGNPLIAIGGGGGGGIESIVAGDNITIDNTDPLNPIVSASGGGSPGGSDNQIQINQSGAFFADSTFQKSDTAFNVGLDTAQQSTVTFTGSGLDDLTVAGTFSGTVPTTYTVTVASTGTPDTFDWTDGTNTGTGVSMSTSPISLSNGISISFGADTGHTLTESWTWTYSNVQNNILDFSNGTYKFGTDFGTDYFGYEVGNNLLGFGLLGSVNTWTSTGGDIGLIGFYDGEDGFGINNLIQFSDGYVSNLSINKGSIRTAAASNTGDIFSISGTIDSFEIRNGISNIYYGIKQEFGAVTVGNLSGGNNTKITIDDVNEHITISNLPAYDDDTAAGVGGLTAGMVYMTTGSGSAPLNAAGILMIKQ